MTNINIQEVFNKVIKNGYYSGSKSTYMCRALSMAYIDKLITSSEVITAKSAINEYLDGFAYLSSLLYENGEKCDFNARLRLYANWEKRKIFPKNRVVQDVFHRVIARGYYSTKMPYMCIAIDAAYTDKVITKQEMEDSLKSIQNYIKGNLSLEGHLISKGHAFTGYPKRLSIYQHWFRRP